MGVRLGMVSLGVILEMVSFSVRSERVNLGVRLEMVSLSLRIERVSLGIWVEMYTIWCKYILSLLPSLHHSASPLSSLQQYRDRSLRSR